MPGSLISINDLSNDQIEEIYQLAQKISKDEKSFKLENQILVNFFFENSTRTRTSFEIAAKRLGMKVINIDISLSSLKKGESISDMAKTINAMNPDFVVIRHNSSGIVKFLDEHICASLINAGDGTNEHPTQALLDFFVIKNHFPDLKGLKVAICGDVLHSRVAHSNLNLLSRFGCKINIISPQTFIPKDYQAFLEKKWQAKLYHKLEDGIKDVDVVMMLRIQRERMNGCYIASLNEYGKLYGLNQERMSLTNDAIIMHPGPINRGVEIASDLVDNSKKSLILDQVNAGVEIRKAILYYLDAR